MNFFILFVSTFIPLLYGMNFLSSIVTAILFCFLMSSEDAERIWIHTPSAAGDIESIQKMVDDSDLESMVPRHQLELWWDNNVRHLR
jgi:hypothetical protein